MKDKQSTIPAGYKHTPIGIIPEDWEVKRVGELGEFYKGKGISKSEIKEKGVPAILYGEIYTSFNTRLVLPNLFIEKKDRNKAFRLKYGDILITGSGEDRADIGKTLVNLFPNEIYAGGDIIVLRPVKAFPLYLSYLFNSPLIKREFFKVSQGYSIVHLYPSLIKNIKIPLPPLEEQKAIAEVLSTWDRALETLDRLIGQKKERKKWLMQQLLTGKKRLPGFSGEWEVRKLEDVATFLKGKGLSKTKLTKQGKNECILYGQLYTTYDTIIKEIISKTNENEGVKSIMGDILFPSSTTTKGEDLANATTILKDNVLIGGDIIIMRKKKNDKYDSMFMTYLLNEVAKKSIKQIASGVTIYHIYPKDLRKIKLRIPQISEQKAIAEVLQTQDREIELLEEKRRLLETQKKGLMQQLLTGKKRLLTLKK